MMLEELERRNYSQTTIRYYLGFVERFAKHFGKSPDKLGPEHLRSYQAYLLRERKLCPGSVENHVAALRFFFIRTLHRHEFRQFLPYPKVPRKLPVPTCAPSSFCSAMRIWRPRPAICIFPRSTCTRWPTLSKS
jgi:integrase